jgi:ribose 5-phosphate isomerase B
MIVAVACDHAGFPLKEVVLEAVRSAGHEPLDLGTDSETPVDYPDNAIDVGRAIQEKRAARGILLCGSGTGAAVAANKMRGIRAGVCHDLYSARQSVEHDDANVLALGARVIGGELAAELVQTFLAAQFSGEERHRRRLAKIRAIEDEQGRGP